MCGIIGLYGSTTHVQTSNKRAFMLEGLYLDALRGMDSTGLAMLPTAKDRDPEIYKRAIGGPDFIEKKTTLRMLGNIGQSNGCIGHNRSSTRGIISDENAHPFQYNHITLVHNGTVQNSQWLLKRKDESDSNVDSAQVAWAFSQAEPDDLLPDMNGGFSLVWWDARDATLHFARNTEKPMYWIVSDDAKMMFFASELGMIRMLLDRHGIKYKKSAQFTAPYKHYVYKNPFNVEEYTVRPFQSPASKSKKQKGTTWQHQGGTSQLNPPARQQQPSSPLALPREISKTNTNSKNTNSPNGTDTDTGEETADAPKVFLHTLDGKKHPAETEKLTRGTVGTITANMEAKDRRRNCAANAEADGFEAFKTITAKPVYWRPYEDETRLGTLFLRLDKINIQIFNISLATWVKCGSMGHVPVEVKGMRLSFGPSDGSTCVYVAEINFDLFSKLWEQWEANHRPATQKVRSEDGADIEMVEVGMLKPRMVTIEEFNELVQAGCLNCLHTVILADAPDLLWYGPSEEWPICKECSSNTVVRAEWEKYAMKTVETQQVH